MRGERRHHTSARPAAVLLYLLLAVAAAWLTADAVRGSSQAFDAPTFETKLDEFLATEPFAEIAFVGSSRIFRGIDPSAFDAATTSAGRPTHSFNLAMPGMNAIEVEYAARTLLAAASERIDTLFVAPGFLTDELAARNERSRRVIDYHDERATLLALRQAWWEEGDLPREFASVQRHLTAWWYRRASVGQLRERILARWQDPERVREMHHARSERVNGPNRDGFVSLDLVFESDPEPLAKRREKLLSNPDEFDRIVARAHRVEPAPSHVVSPVLGEIVDEVAAEASAAGVRIIFLIPPTTHWFVPTLKSVLAERPELAVFDFSNSADHPQLYDRDLWFDLSHLNAQGARRFSEVLAAQWLDLTAAAKPDPGR